MNKLSVSLTNREKLLGWIYYFVQLLALPLLIAWINLLAGSPLNESALNFVYFSINFLCVTLIFFHLLKENSKIALRSPLRCLGYAVAGIVLYWGLSYAVQIIIITVSPDFFNVNDASIGSIAQENYKLIALGTVWLVPLAEETLYRGLIFGQFYNRSPLAAYTISTCIFASVHVIGYIGSYPPLQLLLCFLQYLPAGIALGWAYTKANSIWAPILMHITINQIGIASMR